MEFSTATICFETAELRRIFERQRAGSGFLPPHREITFEELVFRLLEDERQTQPSPKAWAAELKTIAALRESLVLTPEHVDFAFSELPKTPKNARLQAAFHAYLGSAWVRDWAYHAWSLVEHLKESNLSNPYDEQVIFVPSAAPSVLFLETAKAYASAKNGPRVSQVPFAELGAAIGFFKRPVVIHGAAASLLERLSDRIVTLKTRSPLPVALAFAGSPQELGFLRYRLAHSGLRLSRPVGETVVKPDLVTQIRRDTQRPLKDRLHLGTILLEYAALIEGMTPALTAEKLESLGVLSPREKDYLTELDVPAQASVAGDDDDVILFPAIALPQFPNFSALYYLGTDFTKPKPSEVALKDSELETLFRAGFYPQRNSQQRLSQKATLKELGALGLEPRTIFTTLPLDSFGRVVKPFRWSGKPIAPLLNAEDYHVNLPPRRLSASQLESFARCPSQYLFGNRMGLRRRKLLQEESYALLFGQAVHLTLERAFGLTEENHRASAEEIRMLFRGALATLAPTMLPEEPYHVILCESFKKLADNIPVIEQQLRALGSIKQTSAETKFEFPLDDLVFSGKIDRIDQLQNGELLVLDYKTGNVDFCPDHIEQGTAFQALIYLLAVEKRNTEPCAGVLFYDLKKGELRRGFVVQEGLPQEAKKALTRGHCLTTEAFNEIKLKGLTALKQLSGLIRDGNFVPQPSTKSCANCDFPVFCRQHVGMT